MRRDKRWLVGFDRRSLVSLAAGLTMVGLLGGTLAAKPPGDEAVPRDPPHLAAALDAPLLIGHFTTVYPQSAPDRNYNMARAVAAIRGTVVPNGGEFSFNAVVGNASRERGYRKGRVFVGDRIVEDYGGGVCQVATTVYNAALRAGLTVLERHQHGLTVPYLPPGEDATISYGALDLRLRNDTNGPIFFWGEAEGGRVTIDIYGTRPGPEVWFRHKILRRIPFRVIEIPSEELAPSERRLIAPGQEGVTVATWLMRRYGEGPVETTDLGVFTYRPSPRIYLVGVRRPSA